MRQELREILQRAGMQTTDGDGVSSAQTLREVIEQSDCSVHVLGTADIYTPGTEDGELPAGYQYRTAKELCQGNFKMFVWNPNGASNASPYINKIRRNIEENIIYIDKRSPIVFVEDLRNIMTVKQAINQNTEDSDIFFIYNDLDKDTACDICTLLSDLQKVTKLSVSMSNEVDYNSYIHQQLAASKIGVVYYNYAGDWAVSFARQIWKDTGGNSGSTPIYVVGNSEHAMPEQLKIFKGIMECNIDEQMRIPLDIKMFLDKTNQNK